MSQEVKPHLRIVREKERWVVLPKYPRRIPTPDEIRWKIAEVVDMLGKLPQRKDTD